MSNTPPPQPFTISDALQACEGTISTDAAHEKPLRVLARTDDGSFRVSPYEGQPYIAISYCWPGDKSFTRLGSSQDPTTVLAPGGTVLSTHFSRFISRAAEGYDPTLAVWVDFHCINQADDVEKAAQVAIMQRIYTEAKLTLVMLEDLEVSPEERSILKKPHATEESISLVRRILSARWFSRAWCSQELILSHHVHICAHDASRQEHAIVFSSDTLWHCIDSARNRDPSIPIFTQPRGHLPDIAMAKSTCAWALGVVYQLGCSDDYDKVSLVCNLVRLIYHFTSRPTAFRVQLPHNTVNVLKMVNIIALRRRDFSLLLSNHGPHNPFRGHHGFGWAGAPIGGDRASMVWNQKDFQVAEDPSIGLNTTGLVARGCLARVVLEHSWELHRDRTGLHLTIDGYTRAVLLRPHVHSSWSWYTGSRHLRDLIMALASAHKYGWESAALHARIVFAYLLAVDYVLQPDPIPGDLGMLAQTLLGDVYNYMKDIASAIDFIWRAPGYALFSTILLSDGSTLLVSGNASDLTGRLLFQPYVVRPKLFSPPMVLTVNSMVLEDRPLDTGVLRCIGCVRGLGMISDVVGKGGQNVCVV